MKLDDKQLKFYNYYNNPEELLYFENLMKDPEFAWSFACDMSKRISKYEKYILKDPEYSFAYARDIIKGRWPEAEPIILTDAGTSYMYTLQCINKNSSGVRWPEAEHIILTDAESACLYAIWIIKDTWPEAEHIISHNNRYKKRYEQEFGTNL